MSSKRSKINSAWLWRLLCIYLSLQCAMIFETWRLPAWVAWLCPQWVVLWLLCWVSCSRVQLHSGWVWAAGLAMDWLSGRLLGMHVMLYLLLYYAVYAQHLKIYWITIVPRFACIMLVLILIAQLQYGLWGSNFSWLYMLINLSRALLTYAIWYAVDHVSGSWMHARGPQRLTLLTK